ncbi:putative negative acting factor [Rosellinia necatrix]|uniref:Putative negative acting factor n=1 Tax=Rosellinia necatrix TaxID=77044 RepID=A0A1W2TT61_ROSNE|nr:putative negative acting factor [Rosellinia necatrix]
MAEAQEQPQAQPQPEPASAVAEEPAHALPPIPSKSRPEPSSQHSSQAAAAAAAAATAALGHDKPREAQTWAPTPPEAETNASQQQERIRQSPNPQPPDADAARAPEIATAAHEPEKEPAQPRETGSEDQGHQLLQQDHVSDAPISTSTSTSTPPTSSSAVVTEKATVATDQSQPSTTPTTPAIPTDPGAIIAEGQQKATDGQPERDDDGSAATPSSETMSHNQPPHLPGTPRQPPPYSTSSVYATGGMGGAHYGYANPAPPTHDPYRASPHATTNNAMPLPSMRTFDPVQQQSQQQQHMAMAMPLSPVPSAPGQQPLYYQQQVPLNSMVGNAYASLSPDAMGGRFPLPPGGPGTVLTAGRHKKEIKRRTKTGCLTCRKRRIKCDELHPTCKNCQKSKRECMGYDPIFKNQQQPSPQQSQAHQSQAHQSHQPHQSQQAQPPHHATGGIHSAHNSATPTSASSSSSIPLNAPSASVSASASSALTTSTAASYTTVSGMPGAAAPPTSTYSSGLASIGNPAVSGIKTEGHSYHTLDHPLDSGLASSIHKMKVQELVSIGNAVSPSVDTPLSQEKLLEVQDLYEQVYAPGLEKFFETDWYLKPYGSNALASNARVQEILAAFLQSLATTTTSDVSGMAYSANLEFRVVWELATLVYSIEYKTNMGHGLPTTDDGYEAYNRTVVFETLLSGEFLDHNPLRPPLQNPDSINYHRNRELGFWHNLAEFLLIKDQPNMDLTHQRDHMLARLRELLDGRENRDVLYSLAVIRALTHKFPPDFESALPPHLDESDPKSKLAVARKFIQDEARVTGGTTNVVRRFAELGVRAFIAPAYNITR